MHDLGPLCARSVFQKVPRLPKEGDQVSHLLSLRLVLVLAAASSRFDALPASLHLSSTTIKNAIKYIHTSQRADGSWFGSWGICFTYATNFALESLALAGETHANSSSVRRACTFLLNKQEPDGGWGETYMVCRLSSCIPTRALR